MELGHLPVMPDEVLGTLAPAPGSLQIDATVGGGGHTERILEAANPDGRVLGLDADQAAIDRVAQPLAGYGDRLVLRQANFRELADGRAGGGLRGRRRGAVRPRPVERSSSPTASGASASAPAARSTCASTRRAASPALGAARDPRRRRARRPVPRATARSRPRGRSPRRSSRPGTTAPIETAEDLAAADRAVSPGNPRQRRRIHPATRVFQALRIAVNEELDALPEGLASAVDLLRPGGRLVVLSYHSLEDRIVKRFFAAERRGCTCPPEVPVCICGHAPRLRLVTRPSMTPTAGRGRRQPPSPERAPACCRAAGRLSGPRHRLTRSHTVPRRPVTADPVDRHPARCRPPAYGGGVP